MQDELMVIYSKIYCIIPAVCYSALAFMFLWGTHPPGIYRAYWWVWQNYKSLLFGKASHHMCSGAHRTFLMPAPTTPS